MSQGAAQDCRLPLHHPVPNLGGGLRGGGGTPSSWPTSRHHRGRPRGRAGHDFCGTSTAPPVIHMVDVRAAKAGPRAISRPINEELRQYSPRCLPRMLVAVNKPTSPGPTLVDRLRATWSPGCPSSRSPRHRPGVREQVFASARELENLPPIADYEPEQRARPAEIDTSRGVRLDPRTYNLDRGRPGSSGSWPTSTSGLRSRNWFDGCSGVRPFRPAGG